MLESKLSARDEAFGQLLHLYKPVVEMAEQRKVSCIVVAKYLRSQTDVKLVVETLEQAMRAARNGVPILHWIGKGPL